eukprot:SAG31_NODE_1713_length_7466_cov_4.386182_2_plen_161_part_00
MQRRFLNRFADVRNSHWCVLRKSVGPFSFLLFLLRIRTKPKALRPLYVVRTQRSQAQQRKHMGWTCFFLASRSELAAVFCFFALPPAGWKGLYSMPKRSARARFFSSRASFSVFSNVGRDETSYSSYQTARGPLGWRFTYAWRIRPVSPSSSPAAHEGCT